MQISFERFTGGPIDLAPAEAVALAIGAAESVARQTPVPLPERSNLALDCAGRVLVRDLESCQVADPGDSFARSRWLAALLYALLDDGRAPRDGASVIPGGLLVLLARALGRIDLPSPTYAELRAALARFGSDDPALRAAVYRRVTRPAVPTAAPRTSPARRWPPVVAAVSAAVMFGIAIGLGLAASIWLPEEPAREPGFAPAVQTEPAVAGVAFAPVPRALEPSSKPAAYTAAARVRRPRGEFFSPAYAARGAELLFHEGRQRSTLMRASLDANGNVVEVSPVLHDSAANYHATASPDGKWLAYDSDRDGTRGVYIARPDASGARRVSGAGHAAVPTWSPDGRRLAFVKAEPARPQVWNIWIADLESGALTRVTRHAVGQPWGASWFPDGRHIAYSVEETLVIADLQNGTARQVQSPKAGRLVRTPAVSPQGDRIVFQVYRDGIWLFDVGAGTTHRLLADPMAEEFAWAPDGESVAYHTRRNGTWSLWRVAIDSADDVVEGAAAPLLQ